MMAKFYRFYFATTWWYSKLCSLSSLLSFSPPNHFHAGISQSQQHFAAPLVLLFYYIVTVDCVSLINLTKWCSLNPNLQHTHIIIRKHYNNDMYSTLNSIYNIVWGYITKESHNLIFIMLKKQTHIIVKKIFFLYYQANQYFIHYRTFIYIFFFWQQKLVITSSMRCNINF